MNHCVPDWSFDGDLHVTNQKKSNGPDHELVELLWRNGQVVQNSQTFRKQDQPGRRVLRHDQADIRIQDDEPLSWIHNPFDDSFDKEYCSSFFSDLPSSVPSHEVPFPSFHQENPTPPIFQFPPGKAVKRSNMTLGLSHRGSKNRANPCKTITQSERELTETVETFLTSSSGGSDSSFEKTCRKSSDFTSRKRKMTCEESESQTEAAEFESAGGNKSSKRSRAAEVHNLSERKRRDRINEKMKALQELIPHCNKTDKASLLDEAIEYLKSLQLQLQVMWMGGGIGPMMFSGVQQYMSRMSMGMNYQNQMQNLALTDQYARYLAFHQMQTNPQTMNMNMFRFGPQAMQRSHQMPPPGSSI